MLNRIVIIVLLVIIGHGHAWSGEFVAELKPHDMVSTDTPDHLADLHFGEALFQAYQGHWFEAIAQLDTELGQVGRLDMPELDSLYDHLGQANFAIGDFELAYRMHHRAGRALKAVIEANVSESIKNEALYRLARIYFQKGQSLNALHAVERISGEVPDKIVEDLEFLHGQILLSVGKNSEAITVFKGLLEDPGLKGYASYNLGIALMRDGHENDGRHYLDLTGILDTDDPATLAIKDKANLVLGYKLLEESQPDAAQLVLERVRLDHAFSNRALLGWGWADAAMGRYDRSLVPWTLLAKRQTTDAAVQEALLALPYSYGKLKHYGQASALYGQALSTFGHEVDRLSASMNSIRQGKFLDALSREELKKDANWVVKLRSLPETPETFYLLELMASHDFQESLKNYVDLEDLKQKLMVWQRDLKAFEDLVEQRNAYYEPLLPTIDRAFQELDSQMRLRIEQRDLIEKRLKAMLSSPRPDHLMTSDELILANTIDRIKGQFQSENQAESEAFQERLERLEGVLVWQIQTDYDRRLTKAFHHVHALNKDIAQLQTQYESFVRMRQAATQSYRGHFETIRGLRQKVLAALSQVDMLAARQGHLLEVMAINELSKRRDRLDEFVVKTRFALADSYDRAARAQGLERVEQ